MFIEGIGNLKYNDDENCEHFFFLLHVSNVQSETQLIFYKHKKVRIANISKQQQF